MGKLGVVKIGFWRSKYEPDLPEPVGRAWPWKGKREFVFNLGGLESILHKRTYKGTSTCRICNEKCGAGEFSFSGFTWPDGLMHYVQVHNVRPSQSFIEAVNHWSQTQAMNAAGRLPKPEPDATPPPSEKDRLKELLRQNLDIRVQHGELQIRFDEELIVSCMITR